MFDILSTILTKFLVFEELLVCRGRVGNAHSRAMEWGAEKHTHTLRTYADHHESTCQFKELSIITQLAGAAHTQANQGQSGTREPEFAQPLTLACSRTAP